ncbi:hypothetical protein HG537_0F00970 [Torulaspora globosa]|uniref:RNA helicase n=1 Tax=Torulaspora globosa TaxID=48254 RepID=A0A7H9HWQ8_9SACH|nr:hypothetical protein HG537_0F00970 [Torulaspora sp. CBS 2947]
MSSYLTGKGQRRYKRSLESLDGVEAATGAKDGSLEETLDIDNDRTSKDEQDTSDLRLLARQDYLSRREIQKIESLRKDLLLLEEDVKKYGWEALSQREREDIALKRELIELFERKNYDLEDGFKLQDDYIDEKGKIDVARKRQALNNRNDYFQKPKVSKQQVWEERQLQKAIKEEGTDEIVVADSDKYEFVFDNDAAVEFTQEDEDDILPEKDAEYESLLAEKLEMEENRVKSIQEMRKLLPVYQYRDDLLRSIRENQILIVVGETGSGKTTQLPQYLVEDGYTKAGKLQIAVTQPRRVAATSVAARVADEMNVILGNEVGYSIRFDDKTNDKTILKYMTDGMLLQEVLVDPELKKYSCIMIDEAHERTLATDILLGLLKDILVHRKDLKLLVSSATMNAAKFSHFFNGCPIFNVPGRRFPVDIHYTLQPEANYLQAAISTIFQIHTSQPLPGDILVFLTGQEEIESAREKIEEIAGKVGSSIAPMILAPIYANLPQEQQELIFLKTPSNSRKIVLATNIAETSLTIDGIKFVIDPGYVKENSFVPSTGMTQLVTVPCSRASVDQRAGRAGRVGPGKCYRLFTKWSYYNELELMPKPEILRTNLSSAVLLLLSLGISDLINFSMLDKPSMSSLTSSLEDLYLLGALNSKGKITKLGRIMCEFPCEPQFAKVIHTSATHDQCKGILEECVDTVAMLHETASLFAAQKEQSSDFLGEVTSDHMLYLQIYQEWRDYNYSRAWCRDHKLQYKTLCRVRNIRNQLWKCAEKLGLVAMNEIARREQTDTAAKLPIKLTKCFIAGFPTNIAQLGTTGYRTVGKKSTSGLNVYVHPSSILNKQLRDSARKPSKYVLYQTLMLTSKEFMRDCIPIYDNAWLVEMIPQLFKRKRP